MASPLPRFAPFPSATWRAQMLPSEWAACLDAWVALAEAHLALTVPETSSISCTDESVVQFLVSFMRENAAGGSCALGGGASAKALLKGSFLLTSRLLRAGTPPS